MLPRDQKAVKRDVSGSRGDVDSKRSPRWVGRVFKYAGSLVGSLLGPGKKTARTRGHAGAADGRIVPKAEQTVDGAKEASENEAEPQVSADVDSGKPRAEARSGPVTEAAARAADVSMRADWRVSTPPDKPAPAPAPVQPSAPRVEDPAPAPVQQPKACVHESAPVPPPVIETAEGGRAGSRDASPWVNMRPGSAGRRPGETPPRRAVPAPSAPARSLSEQHGAAIFIQAESRPASAGVAPTLAARAPDRAHDAMEAEVRATRPPVPVQVTPVMIAKAVFEGAADRVILTKALDNLAPDVKELKRVEAARALTFVRHELAAMVLVGCVVNDPSPRIRAECLNSLAAIDAKVALSTVEAALKDSAPVVRLTAIRALYRLAGLEAAEMLVAMLVDEDENVRHRAATCLGWLGHRPLAIDLLPFLSDKSGFVRKVALGLLADLRLSQSGSLPANAVVAEVIERLDDPDESVCEKAFEVLGVITGTKIGGALPRDKTERRAFTDSRQAWWAGECQRER